jgi:CheY-like chemotaxis protein
VEDRQRAIAAGFDQYLAKPVDPAALASTVKALLAVRNREPPSPPVEALRVSVVRGRCTPPQRAPSTTTGSRGTERWRRPGVQRFTEPVLPQSSIARWIPRASRLVSVQMARGVDPAHASKAACANQSATSVSTKRTAAFESARSAPRRSRLGTSFGLAGTILGTIEGTAGVRVSRDLVYLAFSPR